MILMIDNYDSFTYNLVQYLGELKQEVTVYRNDAIALNEIDDLHPDMIMISPGPCTPSQAGITLDVIKYFAGRIPILGVCLGHQAIGQVFGAKIIKAKDPVHGKTSMIHHDGRTIFTGLKNPLKACRYHSLVLSPDNFPADLEVSAFSDDGEIMAVRHRRYIIEGVQFHPEAILTEQGHELLNNFIHLCS